MGGVIKTVASGQKRGNAGEYGRKGAFLRDLW